MENLCFLQILATFLKRAQHLHIYLLLFEIKQLELQRFQSFESGLFVSDDYVKSVSFSICLPILKRSYWNKAMNLTDTVLYGDTVRSMVNERMFPMTLSFLLKLGTKKLGCEWISKFNCHSVYTYQLLLHILVR